MSSLFIDECLCRAVAYRDGKYHLEDPLTGREPFDFPELGVLDCYYVDHEESRTLPRSFPQARVVDFKLCLDEVTHTTLRVLQQLGLNRTDKIDVGGIAVAPRDVVVSLLPQPKDLAGRMKGKTCVGTLVRGTRAGQVRAYYIYNVTDHEMAFGDLGVQATAYQTGIPPVVAAELIASGIWQARGVNTPEQLDPDPFLARLTQLGMPWRIRDDSENRDAERTIPSPDVETALRPFPRVAAA
jgi:saccharopine dehydrogenase-like NADP-dependent oxidoreductase